MHELLGGLRRDRIEAYGTIYPMARNEEGVELQVEDAMHRLRLRNVKFAADPWWMEDLQKTRRLLQAARRTLGKDRGLIGCADKPWFGSSFERRDGSEIPGLKLWGIVTVLL